MIIAIFFLNLKNPFRTPNYNYEWNFWILKLLADHSSDMRRASSDDDCLSLVFLALFDQANRSKRIDHSTSAILKSHLIIKLDTIINSGDTVLSVRAAMYEILALHDLCERNSFTYERPCVQASTWRYNSTRALSSSYKWKLVATFEGSLKEDNVIGVYWGTFDFDQNLTWLGNWHVYHIIERKFSWGSHYHSFHYFLLMNLRLRFWCFCMQIASCLVSFNHW